MASAAAKRLQGKTVLVTGASSGIGRSTALEFARTAPKNDLRIILTARRIDSLKELASKITDEVGDGVKVLPVKLDVSNPAEIRDFVGNLPEEWRNIDVLVNNAYVTCSLPHLNHLTYASMLTFNLAVSSRVLPVPPRSRRRTSMSCLRPTSPASLT